MAFNDLDKNTPIDKIQAQQAKAYPSVNSMNDGSYNSEDNMRYLTKSLTTKPFVVGQTSSKVDNSFDKPNEIDEVTSGMVGIDGYLMRLSKAGQVSFDSDSNDLFMDITTDYAQRFIKEMTTGMHHDTATFLFSEYDPYGSNSDALDNLTEAYKKRLCVGYSCITYTDSYYSALAIGTSSVSFANRSVMKYTGEAPASDTADAVKAVISDSMMGFDFAIVDSENSTVKIYYAVYFTDFDIWDEDAQQYIPEQRFQFTDIFGLPFNFSATNSATKTYPATNSLHLQMDDSETGIQNTSDTSARNNALGTFNTCRTTTYPEKMYDFSVLYNGNERKTSLTQTEIDNFVTNASAFPAMSALTSLFDIYDAKTLMQTFVPSSVPANSPILEVKNKNTYFCLKGLSSHLTISASGGTQQIPVAFMTSNGILCPDGFITGNDTNTGVSPWYPVEGYLHYVKRRIKGYTSMTDEREKELQNMNILDYLGDIDSTIISVISHAMSFYLQMAYCSLANNVIKSTSSTAALRFKVDGCGTAIASASGIVSEDFDSIKSYNAPGYRFTAGSSAYTDTTYTTKILYHKDTISDFNLMNYMMYGNSITIPGMNFSLYSNSYNHTTSQNPLMFEDILNYARGCVSTVDTNTINMNLYYYNGSLVASGLVSSSYICVDEYLCPIKAKTPTNEYYVNPDTFGAELSTHYIKSLNGAGTVSSPINGLCFKFHTQCWSAILPYVLTVKKDSLNYLRGKSFDESNPDIYGGVEFCYKLPSQITENDLYLFGLEIGGTNSAMDNDDIGPITVQDNRSKYSKVRREAFLHINKIYGYEFETIEDLIKRLIRQALDNGDLKESVDDMEVQQEIDEQISLNQYDNALQVYRAFVIEGVTGTVGEEDGWSADNNHYYVHNLSLGEERIITIPVSSDLGTINEKNFSVSFSKVAQQAEGFNGNNIVVDWWLGYRSLNFVLCISVKYVGNRLYVQNETVTVSDSSYQVSVNRSVPAGSEVPIVKQSVTITGNKDGTDFVWTDDGQGGFASGKTTITGASIDYSTGTITFPAGTYTDTVISYQYMVGLDSPWAGSARAALWYSRIGFHPKFIAIFDTQGGEITVPDTTPPPYTKYYKTIIHSTAYGTLPTPVKEGYTFNGWYDGSTNITAESIVTKLDNVALTAHWTENN